MDIYRTDYLPEAAYIYSCGIPLSDVRRRTLSGKWVTFSFENVPDEILKKWQSGKAEGNVLVYYNALKYLRDKIAEVIGGWSGE